MPGKRILLYALFFLLLAGGVERIVGSYDRVSVASSYDRRVAARRGTAITETRADISPIDFATGVVLLVASGDLWVKKLK